MGILLKIGTESLGSVVLLTDSSNGVLIQEPYQMKTAASHDPEATVSESVRVRWTSQTAGEAAGRTLTTLFQQARRYQMEQLGERVFVWFLPSLTSDWVRSELRVPDGSEVAGRVEPGPQALHLDRYNQALELIILWTRRGFWESSSETTLALTNGNGTTSSGLTVWSHDDTGAGNDCYAAIAGSAILGDLPAPCRIEITNTTAAGGATSDEAGTVRIGHNVWSNPGSLAHMLEAEAGVTVGTAVTTVVTPGLPARASNGQVAEASWTSTAELRVLEWTLSTSLLNACAGASFRLLLSFYDAHASYYPWYWATLLPATGDYIARTPRVRASLGHVLDLGELRLPPQHPGGNAAPLTLAIWANEPAGNPVTARYDFLQLTPVESYTEISANSTGSTVGVEHLQVLVDDGMAERVYVRTTGGERQAHFRRVKGAPVRLVPGRDQRLYFLVSEQAASLELLDARRTSSVKVIYRPRYSAL